jgi:hypothetical protein
MIKNAFTSCGLEQVENGGPSKLAKFLRLVYAEAQSITSGFPSPHDLRSIKAKKFA